MRTIVILLGLFVTFTFNTIKAQDYNTQLDTIQIYGSTSELISFNKDLLKENAPLNRHLKHAKKNQENIAIDLQDTIVEISRVNYLKKIRKSANRSVDSIQFLDRLSEELPVIENLICNDETFKLLYQYVKPYTINGKLEELPSVL